MEDDDEFVMCWFCKADILNSESTEWEGEISCEGCRDDMAERNPESEVVDEKD